MSMSKLMCSICDQSLLNNEIKMVFFNCGHYFHKPCLQRWCTMSDWCPNCYKRIDLEKSSKVFLSGNDKGNEENQAPLRHGLPTAAAIRLKTKIVNGIKNNRHFDTLLETVKRENSGVDFLNAKLTKEMQDNAVKVVELKKEKLTLIAKVRAASKNMDSDRKVVLQKKRSSLAFQAQVERLKTENAKIRKRIEEIDQRITKP